LKFFDGGVRANGPHPAVVRDGWYSGERPRLRRLGRLSDDDIDDLVAFIKTGGVIDTSSLINTVGAPGSFTYSFNGTPATGASVYAGGVNAAADCTICHAGDGTAIDFGGGTYVGTEANSNPQETLHKIRLGHPGSSMTSFLDLGMTETNAADVGAFCETLP